MLGSFTLKAKMDELHMVDRASDRFEHGFLTLQCGSMDVQQILHSRFSSRISERSVASCTTCSPFRVGLWMYS